MKKKAYSPGLFDHEHRLHRLTKLHDPLVEIGSRVNFEQFRAQVEQATLKANHNLGGRPPFDRVMLFKALILKALYGLSDDQLEYQINDRLSFQRFLGLGLDQRVPDAKTLWFFSEMLNKKSVLNEAFELFKAQLKKEGYMVSEGKIIDATLVKAPVQRNSREENQSIKNGETPQLWSDNKRRQKDTDADWTQKNGKSHFGYKNHIKIDNTTKLIEQAVVTPASIHDSQMLDLLLEESDQNKTLFADSAYTSKATRNKLRKQKIRSMIHTKGTRNKALTERQKAWNSKKSKTRARVEHVFASLKSLPAKLKVRTIGFERAIHYITLCNLSYNIQRYTYLKCKA